MIFNSFKAATKHRKMRKFYRKYFLENNLEGVWSLISKHIVQCLNTEQYCSKTKKICLVDHSGTGVFEKYCSKHMFKTIVFEITFGLILNNKNYC